MGDHAIGYLIVVDRSRLFHIKLAFLKVIKPTDIILYPDFPTMRSFRVESATETFSLQIKPSIFSRQVCEAVLALCTQRKMEEYIIRRRHSYPGLRIQVMF